MRRVGGRVRTVLTVLRVVVEVSARGFLVAGRELETGIRWGCFVGAEMGCA